MSKVYAVKVGKTTGIFHSWDECRASVHNYPGAVYKSFQNEEEAMAFLGASDSAKDTYGEEDTPACGYAYVDGSINPATMVYGAGGFLVDDKGEKHILQGSGNDPEMASMRNVAGEILGAQLAMEKALSLGMQDLILFYDYQGIECWATGMWKRKQKGTQDYYEYCQSIKDRITVHFRKVKGHTGIDGNEEADILAKQAVGVPIPSGKKTVKEPDAAKPLPGQCETEKDPLEQKAYGVYLTRCFYEAGIGLDEISGIAEEWADRKSSMAGISFHDHLLERMTEKYSLDIISFKWFHNFLYQDVRSMHEMLPKELFIRYAEKKGIRVCKNCGSIRFGVTAHVTQDWIVDYNGAFEKCSCDCVEVTHAPDDGDVWTCAECGEEL